MTTILRLITALSKLPAHPGTLAALAADITAADASENVVLSRCEGQEAEDALHSKPSVTTNSASTPAVTSPPSSFSIHPSAFPPPPPHRDCSSSPIRVSSINAKDATTPPLNPTPAISSATARPATQAARKAFLSPAHLAIDDPDSSAVTELKITPQSLDLTPNKHSSRRERRRLQRLTAKK